MGRWGDCCAGSRRRIRCDIGGITTTEVAGIFIREDLKVFRSTTTSTSIVACRYVERNPLRAKLVNTAKDWPHGSLYRWNQSKEPDTKLLSPWPIRRLPSWNERVDKALTAGELKELRTCVDRSRPYGSEEWVEQVAERHGLWHTLRPAGRPRKRPKPKVESK